MDNAQLDSLLDELEPNSLDSTRGAMKQIYQLLMESVSSENLLPELVKMSLRTALKHSSAGPSKVKEESDTIVATDVPHSLQHFECCQQANSEQSQSSSEQPEPYCNRAGNNRACSSSYGGGGANGANSCDGDEDVCSDYRESSCSSKGESSSGQECAIGDAHSYAKLAQRSSVAQSANNANEAGSQSFVKLCKNHSVIGATLANNSQCAVCISKFYLTNYLHKVSNNKHTLARLHKAITECQRLQTEWNKSLLCIACSVKDSKLPEFTRPLLSQYGTECANSKNITLNPQIIISTDGLLKRNQNA